MASGGTSPGGGSQSITAAYSGNNVSIANGADGLLTWDSIDSEVDILDIGSPAHPTVLADGTYIVSAWVRSFPLTPGGFYIVDLVLDPDVGVAEIQADSPPGVVDFSVNVCVSAGTFIPAGGEITCLVSNIDGAATRNFLLKNATIVFIPS